MSPLNLIFVFLIFVASPFLSIAQNTQQSHLLNQQKRPKVELFFKDANLLVPFGNSNTNYASLYNKQLPRIIVALEKAYPGATYGFLGRDMDLLADAIEAFYLSIGQKNRVSRIELSTPSFAHWDSSTLTEFLQERGLSRLQGGNDPMFILLDVTSYNRTSQSNIIVSSVLKTFEDKYRVAPSQALTKYFNVAFLERTTAPLTIQRINLLNTDKNAAQSIIHQQAQEFANDRITMAFVIGKEELAYGAEWHSKYGPLARDQKGKLHPTLESNAYDDVSRNIILSSMIEIINIVQSKVFLKTVTDLAAAEGIAFNGIAKNIEKLQKEMEKQRHEEFLSELKDFTTSLTALGQNRDYTQRALIGNEKLKITENAFQILQVINNPNYYQLSDYFKATFQFLISAYKNDVIGSRDFRRLFLSVMHNYKLKNDDVRLILRFDELEPISILLDRVPEREKYSRELTNMALENYQLLTSKGHRPLNYPLSCRGLFLMKPK